MVISTILLVVISNTLLVVISLVKQTAMLKRIITTTFTARIGLILSTPFVRLQIGFTEATQNYCDMNFFKGQKHSILISLFIGNHVQY